jgi:hypothetical protein
VKGGCGQQRVPFTLPDLRDNCAIAPVNIGSGDSADSFQRNLECSQEMANSRISPGVIRSSGCVRLGADGFGEHAVW